MTYQNNDIQSLNWDDEINEDPKDFIILAPGTYEFMVQNIERSYYDGSDKLPPCNMAILTLKIETEEGDALVFDRLYLTSKTQGFLSAFFTAIGDKKKGEALRMDWGKALGKTGVVKIKNEEYNGQVSNRVDRYMSPDTQYQSPSQSTEQQTEPSSWQGGRY